MTRLSEHILCTLLLVCLGTAHAEERILAFHSAIQIHHDASMAVTETIEVIAEGKQIRRGIFRDFPTDYRDRFGNRYRVAFAINAVQHNGEATAWRSERRSNGIRIYIGNPEVSLPSGRHNYQIRYTTNRQLGFFDEFDELYWNVTGNDWDFPIMQASAEVTLPQTLASDMLRLNGYTGDQGSTAKDLRWQAHDQGAVFHTTTPLPRHQGLTIVIGWPKGLVMEPSSQQQLYGLLDANRGLLIGVFGLTILTIYYLLVWRQLGKDPAAGTIYPQYSAPDGYSPASTRFIREMGYDHQTFTAAIVNLAVNGYLQIDDHAGTYTLIRQPGWDQVQLAPGEQALASALFRHNESVPLQPGQHGFFQAALKAHEKALKRDYGNLYFRTNSAWLIPGVLLSMLTGVAAIALIGDIARMFATVLFSILSIILLSALGQLARDLNSLRRHRGDWAWLKALIQLVVIGVVLANTWPAVHDLAGDAQWSIVGIVWALLSLNYAFRHWLKAPTLAGRRLLDDMDGFRLYLTVAEHPELRLKNPPDTTPAHFEALLPYAIALGVEDVWGRHFAATTASSVAGGHYQPGWYHGSGFDHRDMSGFSSGVAGGIAGGIAASATAPGSSSGGSGGSSGGGGGGGGGGGW